MIETGEILQTMAMIQEQNFDIRTITLGINLLDLSTRKNGSNTRSFSSSGIPLPVSSTDRQIFFPFRYAVTVTCPPKRLYLIAFSTRLYTIR